MTIVVTTGFKKDKTLWQVTYRGKTKSKANMALPALVKEMYEWLCEDDRTVFVGTSPKTVDNQLSYHGFRSKSVFYLTSRTDLITCKIRFHEVVGMIIKVENGVWGIA